MFEEEKGRKIMKLKRKCSIVLRFCYCCCCCVFYEFYLLASHNPFHWLSPKNSVPSKICCSPLPSASLICSNSISLRILLFIDKTKQQGNRRKNLDGRRISQSKIDKRIYIEKRKFNQNLCLCG